MCGRFNLFERLQDLGVLFTQEIDFQLDDWKPSYNIAPSAYCPVYFEQEGIKLDLFHWGLIPSWSEDRKIAFKTINARSETAHKLPCFRHAFKSQRALIPVNGWYEWFREGGKKQPYYHYSTDLPVLMIAGLREYWTDKPTGEHIQSFSLLTQNAYGNTADIHIRMPVLIEPGSWSDWLNPGEQNPNYLNQLIADQRQFDISIHPVTSQMNNARFQGPDCIKPLLV